MNKRIKLERGITLIAVIITIVVLLVIAGIAIRAIAGEDSLMNKSVQARFLTDFKQVEESVRLYVAEKQIDAIGSKKELETKIASTETFKMTDTKNTKISKTEDILPVTTMLTSSEKETIKNSVPTLVETIKKVTDGKTVDQRTLYWIDLDKLNLTMNHKYIIDSESMQIYDYQGEEFSKCMWHIPEIGVDGENTISFEEGQDDIWDGWITLSLYYPSEATEKKWRLSQEGETRYDENLAWEDYTGPITVRLSQIESIWVKYKVGGEEIIIPPLGKLLVDIDVNPTGGKREEVRVKINYDQTAQTKQYRINGGEWKDYEGEFITTENVLIEAIAVKEEKIYDENGIEISTRNVTGKDAYFIRSIVVEEVTENLEAPTIQRLAADSNVEGEVARVKITYPEKASEKIYKENYGKENTYTEEISIKKYGTEILAYYRTQEGKKSQCSSIIIDSKNTSLAVAYTPYYWGATEIPQPEGINGPKINITNQADNEKATITLSTAKLARKIYIQLGDEKFKEYTDPVTVNKNMIVRAYYITEEEGETSRTSYARVSGLYKQGKPWVTIDANPYPYGNSNLTNEVTVTISSSEAEIEYSYDGITYEKYAGAIKVTQNCRIYAKATNDKGTTEEYLDITNIGNKPSIQKEKLIVNINVSPEPSLTTVEVDKVQVSIDYDQKATGKYYSIGRYGKKQEYTGPFELTANCTLYAYATSSKGNGQTNKIIDNITTGIAEPIISASPANTKQTAKTKITITYDKKATTRRYEINGDGLRDYAGEFEVTENCIIRAVNTNSLGQSSETIYEVSNIVSEPPKVLLDKGDYYLLKLPFPEVSAQREYKYKENGAWKGYPEAGLLLIKPDKKDAVLKDDKVIIKIEDENGNKITFTGDWYILDVPISQLFEHIFMRWDIKEPTQPTIILDTTEPTKKVIVSINYENNLVKKQYNILYPDGTRTGWKNYTKEIEITQKGTIIYARGMDETEKYTKEAIKEITNIDEEPPTIKVTADLETKSQKVGIKVEVIDDVKVEKVAWAKGIQKESYFTGNGTTIENNSIIYAQENGYYTIYAEDGVGNKQTYTLQVENVDLTPPEIAITTTPETTIGTEIKIGIEYGDSTTKQYKIGENNATWTNYTQEITLTSYTVLSNNWKNADNTVTIYAKGKDSAGNEIIETKKILNLDVDAPAEPIIQSNYGYPILTEYGVTTDGKTTITYDTRKGIKNYYSLDSGTTWQEYTGSFNITGNGTIIAKSIKTGTGLETIASKTITQPADALGPAAYDGDSTSYVQLNKDGTLRYINVDSNMWNQKIFINLYASTSMLTNQYIDFLNSEGTTLSSIGYVNTSKPDSLTIPNNTVRIRIRIRNDGTVKIYEIRTANEAMINVNKYYPRLTPYGVEPGYDLVNINYVATSEKRLYKIDDGEWKAYTGGNIRLEIGETIYAKGIDKYGEETRIISSYTSVLPADALEATAYDGDSTSYVQLNKDGTLRYINVDSNMWNQKIFINLYASTSMLTNQYIDFLNSEGTILSSIGYVNASKPDIITIPNNTVRIRIRIRNDGTVKIYEIRTANEAMINVNKYYPKLTPYGVELGYDLVTISYSETSVQKLYKIGDGEWKKYTGVSIRLATGETIYAKGIDKYGEETRIISSYTSVLPADAIGVEAYDGDINTYIQATKDGTLRYIDVDSSIWNKKVFVNLQSSTSMLTTQYIDFLNSEGTILLSKGYVRVDTIDSLTIPNNTAKIRIRIRNDGTVIIKEIGIEN